MAIRVESPKKKINDGGIRHPDQQAPRLWMFRPDGSPARVAVCQNMNNNILRARNGEVVMTADADAAGWKDAEPIVGPDAIREADAWDEACKATKGRKAIPPPRWIAEAQAKTRIDDDEPAEGWRHVEAAEKKKNRAAITAKQREAEKAAGA